jgi:hypothetical protein
LFPAHDDATNLSQPLLFVLPCTPGAWVLIEKSSKVSDVEDTLGSAESQQIAFLRGRDRILDSDGDGVKDVGDRCPDTQPVDVVDATGCSIVQLCPCAGPLGGGLWKNHDQYVACVSSAANNFVKRSLITNSAKRAIVTTAAQSQCGK